MSAAPEINPRRVEEIAAKELASLLFRQSSRKWVNVNALCQEYGIPRQVAWEARKLPKGDPKRLICRKRRSLVQCQPDEFERWFREQFPEEGSATE